MISQLCIRNARIVNVWNGSVQSAQDILVQDGIVKKIGEIFSIQGPCHMVDAEGAFVTPGWVDAHTHFDMGDGREGFDLMRTYPPDGVTCAVDAGSRGAVGYESMYAKIAAVPLPFKTYLHVAKNGCGREGMECRKLENLDKEQFLETYQKYQDVIIGVKIRIDPRVNCDTQKTLRIARNFARELNLPLIIHPTRCEDHLEDILSVLEKGDVYAHSYSQLKPCIIDETGQVKPCVREARERGVYFDLSHGSSNFSYQVGRQAVAQGFLVDVISTDLHAGNIRGPVFCLADTMSKCLHIGMNFGEVLRRVTVNAADMLGLPDKSLAVEEGQKADLTVFRLEEGEFPMADSMKVMETLNQRFVPVLTVYEQMLFSPRQNVYWMQDQRKETE